ncbi:hypothetical protein PtB15_13B467 [Puccinia triticina]|nr:hypothetical protein PtB15_13B467 [Puccinia triticina]
MHFSSLLALVTLLYIQSQATHGSMFPCNDTSKPHAKGVCMAKIIVPDERGSSGASSFPIEWDGKEWLAIEP